jgi:phospholipase C
VNHVIYMLQENRSFDHYFGQLNSYRRAKGLSPDVDGTPVGAAQLSADGLTSFTPFHLQSMCIEDVSPYWNESHNDWNHTDPTSETPAMDGFAISAGNDSLSGAAFDINGQRVMGYYDSTDLPYYYFMATQFAISDRWFSPTMTNTPANRMYSIAGTSAGFISKNTSPVNLPTIFDKLEAANVSWKVYVPEFPQGTALQGFPVYQKFLNTKIVPLDQYFTDLANGTLPQVAMIERASTAKLDEHPGPGGSVQNGAAYVAGIINKFMASSAWKDSVFFLAYDEFGGTYDHVAPVSTVSPDGIAPMLAANDTCIGSTSSTCDFRVTGFRVPNIVISPFAKQHYVDHTPMDTTAILRFIEIRFGLQPLTERDGAQPNISYFFDFTGKPNLNPPAPPNQPTNGPCYIDALP